jgi:hypothetical protein
MSDASSRLQRAMAQAVAVEKRAGVPYERIANVESTCPACQVIILPGDLIASPIVPGTSWRHLKCAVCLKCGEWLTAESECGGDCIAERVEPGEPSGSWHDLSVIFTAPTPAFARLYSEATAPEARQKLPWCRMVGVKKLAEPSRMTPVTRMRAHLQFFTANVFDPNRVSLTQEAAKNIGLLIGSEYVHWDVVKGAFDLGDVSISDEQVLSRPPAWAISRQK